MIEPCKLALVGVGRIGREYLRAIERLDAGELTAIVEPDAARRAEAREATDVRAFESVDELRVPDPVDAAIVASPPATHEDATIALLEAGCDVFCEKPLATSARAARRMADAAAYHGRTLMVASKFRFVDDVRTAKRLLAEGAIGQPILYSNSFCSVVQMKDRWNADPSVSGGGVVFDNGAHAFDLARFLLGPIARVHAVFAPRSQPFAVEDTARVQFETRADRAIGAFELSWSIPRASETYVEIHGTAGTLELGWQGGRRRRTGETSWTAFGTGYDKLAAFVRQLEHFLTVRRGAAAPEVTPDDGVDAVRLIEAAYRSAECGAWTEPEDVE